MSRLFITTAIPYVNAAPHVGHALELVQADTLARHARLRGREVRALTGTDDHAAKNEAAARAEGRATADLVGDNASSFAALRATLDLSFDDFISTSRDPRHRPAVERLWNACAASGDLYERDYEGRYCTGCEAFVDEDDLVGGECPEHHRPPERVTERNWFFRLSRYQDQIIELLETRALDIVPEHRRNEVLAFVRAGLRDFSVSRPASRTGGWGIAVPGDPAQTIYVWFDALVNYVSALEYGASDGNRHFERWWNGADERVHVIGKGIVRFHAVYWPAMLLSAGVALPHRILVHDYLTSDGRKIAKSLGNTVSPSDVVGRYGTDALRWWLLSAVPRVGDADFTEAGLIERANQDLANGIGNLAARTLRLAEQYGSGAGQEPAFEPEFARRAELADRIDTALSGFDFRGACQAIRAVVDGANRHLEATEPWRLGRTDPAAARQASAPALRALETLASELSPFTPALAAQLAHRLSGASAGSDHPQRASTPFFARLPVKNPPRDGRQ